MHLTPREVDKLILHQAGFLAQKRLARGVRLNYVEAVALIATQLLEFIRDGRSVADLMDLGRRFLGTRDVLDGIPEMVDEVQVEGTFPDGTKLVTVHRPIVAERGDHALALYGSFLAPLAPEAAVGRPASALAGAPGEVLAESGEITLNDGPRRRHHDRREHRRPARPGRQPLPLLRDQSRAGVRPAGRLRAPPRHPRGHRGPVRAGRGQDREPGAHRRRPRRPRGGTRGRAAPSTRTAIWRTGSSHAAPHRPAPLRRPLRTHHRRPAAPGRHRPRGRGRGGRDRLRRRVQVRGGKGPARRHGTGGGGVGRARARLRDHQRPHRRLDGHPEGGRRHQERAHRGHRQGRQPGRHGRGERRPRGGGDDRGHRRRGADPDRGGHRRPRALHLAPAGVRGGRQRG